jgi:signal transduction histidine kinase
VAESAEAIVQVVAQIKETVRGMIRRIRPSYLEGLGLEAGLREQVAAFRNRNPEILCMLDVQVELAGLDEEVAVTIYRIVQESLTNIAVHANAHNVLIDVRAELAAKSGDNEHDSRDHIRLTITDDGAGFFQLTANRGLGLTGIRERARALGGSCAIVSEPGHGTRIEVLVPHKRMEEIADA